MEEELGGRPLVTFALFGYNQEEYIREAIEGAFSQNYEPLEIILSDDCSKDRTFEIMQEMATSYDGPHQVRFRKTANNQGLLAHINSVIDEVNGQIVIMAAGDDISLPFRSSLVVNAFACMPENMAIYTDTVSKVPTTPSDIATVRNISALDIAFKGGGVGSGAAYAYKRDCFLVPQPLPLNLYSEDRVLPMRAALLGGVGHVNVASVVYRDVVGSMTDQLKGRRSFSYENLEHLNFLIKDVRSIIGNKRWLTWRPVTAIIALRIFGVQQFDGIWWKSGAGGFMLRLVYKIICIFHSENKVSFKIQ